MRTNSSISNKIVSYHPLALAVSLAFLGAVNTSQAAIYVVTNTDDSGVGSLRNAVQQSNSVTPDQADTIEFSIPSGSTINLGSELIIGDTLTIKGPVAGDSGSIILDAGGTNRHINGSLFSSNSGKTITLENTTLKNGYSDGTGLPFSSVGGGAVFVKNADLILNHSLISGSSTAGANARGGGLFVKNGNATLNQSTVSGNSTTGASAHGGGLCVDGFGFSGGNATLYQSTVSGNSTAGSAADGGGLYVYYTATFDQSTVSGNSTVGDFARGGGLYIYYYRGNSIFSQSTISKNSTAGSDAHGAGMYIQSGNATFNQSTVSGNSTAGSNAHGGGIFINNGNITLNQSTMINNSAGLSGGGISFHSTSNNPINIILKNSILAGNAATFGGNIHNKSTIPLNLIQATNSVFGDNISEITNPTDLSTNIFIDIPNLGPLQFNGGLTQTHKPKHNSAGVNLGSNTIAATFSTDQRGAGFPRIHSSIVDVGAVELQNNILVGDPPLNIDEVLTRRDMARELLKISLGPSYSPPPATGTIFSDVNINNINADWIEDFSIRGYTEGCAMGKFCPNSIVTREEIAKIYLKVFFANGTYSPPTPQGETFNDVLDPDPYWPWIEKMVAAGALTDGCRNNKFCPKEPIKRKWFNNLLAEL